MATTAFMCKKLGALRPSDAMSSERLDAVPEGTIIKVEWTRPRNLQHHRWFFAALNLLYERQSHYATLEDLRQAILIYLGHYHEFKLRDGRVVVRAKSISFANMDQTTFDELSRAFVAMIVEMLPGVTDADVWAELEAIIA